MRTSPVARAAAIVLAMTAGGAAAQGAAVGFDGLRQDPSAPVEVTSEELSVDQARGAAVFTGNVVVVQGALRLAAGSVTVEYDTGGTGIRRMTATGGVTFATADDAAESREATYDVASGALVLTGDVVLTQGPATITGERLVADLVAGTGRMEGRVRTVFRPAN
ncbi:MAG: lipopolysaccharide transport periplasmic protein LptA [Gemmobacter sp.]